MDPARGIVPTLAAQQAAIAVIAMLRALDQPKHRPARNESQQGAQRTKGSAPKPRDAKIQRNHEDEDESQPDSLAKIWLFETEQRRSQNEVQDSADGLHRRNPTVLKGVQDGAHPIVCCRKDRQAYRAH